MTQPAPGLTADATTAPTAHWRRLSSPTHHDRRRHGAEASGMLVHTGECTVKWRVPPRPVEEPALVTSEWARPLHVISGSGLVGAADHRPTTARCQRQPAPRDEHHRRWPRAAGSWAGFRRVSGVRFEASPVAAGHEARRRQL
jgi:hypothetical protein